MTLQKRVSKIVEQWLILEPLLFRVWSLHRLEEINTIATIRINNGTIEYNSNYLNSLTDEELSGRLTFEALRIILKHPYSRRPPNGEVAYAASNITLQEYYKTTTLPFKNAFEFFETHLYDRKYYEFYYEKILENLASSMNTNSGDSDSSDESSGESDSSDESSGESDSSDDNSSDADSSDDSLVESGTANESSGENDSTDENNISNNNVDDNGCAENSTKTARENTINWGESELMQEAINEHIKEIELSNLWGSLLGKCKFEILKTTTPKMNYRSVLMNFRASVLSEKRSLTRMKPSRRYGFACMGSKYEFVTKILVAIDVSASMTEKWMAQGLTIINQFFKYGIIQIDVILFDTELKGPPLKLRKARNSLQTFGRGGTDFSPVIEYIDMHKEYDGLIFFTDGYASVPKKPLNSKTRILWIFVNENTYKESYERLKHFGKSTFIKYN